MKVFSHRHLCEAADQLGHRHHTRNSNLKTKAQFLLNKQCPDKRIKLV